jgi:hypothetical protein
VDVNPDNASPSIPRFLYFMCYPLRQALIEAAMAKVAAQGREGKMERMYSYLTGPHFRQRVSAIVEACVAMQEDLEAEKRLMTKQWAKRQRSLELVKTGTGGTAGMLSKYPELSILSPRDIGTIVATACLLHDIGNPPFGHSGEKAIGRWFSNNIDTGIRLKLPDATERNDLTEFEGNAQSFRIATRLQWSGQDFGMNLTAATLSTLIKYPCASNQVQPNGKKH